MIRYLIPTILLVLCASVSFADSQDESDTTATQGRASTVPDIRGDDSKLKVEKGNFIAVPIPLSDPTLGTGLVVGGGYFYPQTEEQKNAQPASVTGAGGMYTDSDSYAIAAGHAAYWNEDRWRFVGAVGYADLTLPLLPPDASANGSSVDWDLRGAFVYASLSRRVAGHWYAGLFGRFVDINQEIALNLPSGQFDLPGEINSGGLGLEATFDSRDMPTNAYQGRYFQANGLFNGPSFGGDDTYQSYKIAYSSYHKLSAPVVLAWEVSGCLKSGSRIPLWDACRLGLRGFPATDYMGKSSVIGQFEARWKMSKRWGLVGFAGAGQITESFSELRDQEIIPSYGFGLRFMVLQSKRINLRLDYGRSTDSDAIYLSVGEAF